MKNVFQFKHDLIDAYAKFSTSFAKPSAQDIAAELKKQYEKDKDVSRGR